MTSILISGAGIAGTTLAYWLRHHGFTPTVVERAAEPRAGGQAIDVRGSALGVVERMGLLPRVHGAATEMRGMSFVNARGRKLVSVTEHTLTGGLTGSDDIEILRDDLNNALYEASRDDVEYVFGDWLTGLEQHETGVRATFANGAPREFDLVAGADGLHSGVRALTFGDGFLHHLGTYLAVFTTGNFLGLDHWQTFHMTPGKMSGLYSARNNTEARAILGFTSPPLDFDRHDLDQQHKLVADAFDGHGWEADRLIAGMAAAPDFYFDSVAQIRLDRWTDGRVALLGDAGYAASLLSGMGTSQALVGAYVLAGELKAAAGDYRSAFAGYEREMRPYVEACRQLALTNQPKQTRFAQWSMIQSMRLLPYLPFRAKIMAAGLRAMTEAANAVTLKSY